MADKTWDKESMLFEEEIHKSVHKSWLEITERMKRIGLKNSDAVEWFSVIKTEVNDLMQQFITESEDRENVISDEIIALLQQAQGYCEALRIPMEAHGHNEQRDLTEEKVLLKKRIEEYETLLQSKRKDVKILQKRNIAVSKSLSENPIEIDNKIIPTEKQLQELLSEIEKREMKRFEREETFLKTKEKLMRLINEFEIVPVSEFQTMLVGASLDTFILSEVNMKLLAEFYTSVVNQSNSLIKKVNEVRQKVRSLWDMLAEDIQKCDEFVKRCPGSSQSTLDAFRSEVVRCEDLRKANIGKFVEKLRSEISVLWNKCHYTLEEREAFQYFKYTFYNEDILELHDRELEHLQCIYAANQNILAHLEEHETVWKKLEDLEDNASNPSRLFNRGGKLLKEEKERNTVQRKIPKIDAALIKLSVEYEKDNGKQFRSYGRTIQEIIDEKHGTHEIEKQLKLSARKLKKADLTPGKSTSNINLARTIKLTPDVKSASKRFLSPRNATTSKKARILTVHRRAIQKLPVIKLNSILLDVSSRTANKRKRIEKTRRLSDFLNNGDHESYTEFSVKVSKSTHRSTAVSLEDTEELLAVPLAKTPPNPSRINSAGTPTTRAGYQLSIASNKNIIL